MANIVMLDVSADNVTDDETTATLKSNLAATQEIPVKGKHHRLYCHIENGSATHAATVVFKAPTDSTKKGVRAGLGDYTVTVAANKSRLFKLADTARFLDLSTGKINVTGEIAEGGSITDVKIWGIYG